MFLTLEAAARVARQSTQLDVDEADLRHLVGLGILPDFGDPEQPRILDEHAQILVGKVGTLLEIVAKLTSSSRIPASVDIAKHVLVHLSPTIALSFDPGQTSSAAIQSYIRAIRSRKETSGSPDESGQTLCAVSDTLCLWLPLHVDTRWYVRQWKRAGSAESQTTTVESLCVPSIYGNKARLTPFILAAIRQHLPSRSPICDLMSGTGLVTRQLLPHYRVYANDAAKFAETLTASQSISIAEVRARVILEELRLRFDENLSAIRTLFEPALTIEEQFLLGDLSPERLASYRDFALACTHFVPEAGAMAPSECWNADMDDVVRSRVLGIVNSRRDNPRESPYVMATAYWGNCYFGLRQAGEIDSLRFAIEQIVSDSERQLLGALLLASIDACASGPHFAQPPRLESDAHIRKLIDRRSRSVYGEFKLRLLLACRRPPAQGECTQIGNLPWRAALKHFSDLSASARNKGVYVDPPYSRLQYSRFYHVFDSLLRYDYPACINKGRTSEKEKRFSSRFDARESSAVDEFRSLFQSIRDIDGILFVSYSTGVTVPVDVLLELARSTFRFVSVYTSPVRHHSQGQTLKNRGRRLELLIVGKP